MKTDKIIIKLEENMKTMTSKLSEIETDIKELIKIVNGQVTNSALSKKDITNLGIKVNDIDVRLKTVEDKQTYLIAKVSTVATIIAGAIGWIFNR